MSTRVTTDFPEAYGLQQLPTMRQRDGYLPIKEGEGERLRRSLAQVSISRRSVSAASWSS